jgi:RND family efflux transporter MFP subunit
MTIFSRNTAARRRPIALWPAICLALLSFPAAAASAQNASQPELATARAAYHSISLSGFTRPRRVMELVSEESARCLEVLADVGEALGEDGVFARLDTTFIELDLEKVQAEQARAESEAEYYAKQVERYKDLVGGRTAAQKDLDDFIRLHSMAREELKALEVQERILREHLKRYVIKGPPGWRVIERFAEPGEWISSGEHAATVGDFNTLLVPFALTDEEYDWLSRRSGNLTLYVPSEEKRVAASIERVAPDFDPQTRKIKVELEVSGGLEEMRGGVRMELDFRSEDPTGAVLLPRAALMERYEEFFVLTPEGERIKVIYAGAEPGGLARVMSEELSPGDTVQLNPKP